MWFYIFKKEIIKNYNRRIGNNPYVCEVDELEAIDIDDQFDFDIANYLLEKYQESIWNKYLFIFYKFIKTLYKKNI